MSLSSRKPRTAAFVALLGGLLAADPVLAIPTVKNYAFDFTSINLGTGSFTITAEDTANPVQHTAQNSPISNFSWTIPGLNVTFGQANLVSFFTDSWADGTPYVLERYFFYAINESVRVFDPPGSSEPVALTVLTRAFINQTSVGAAYEGTCVSERQPDVPFAVKCPLFRNTSGAIDIRPLPESVPEPTELALLGVGLLVVNQLRRRAERRQA